MSPRCARRFCYRRTWKALYYHCERYSIYAPRNRERLEAFLARVPPYVIVWDSELAEMSSRLIEKIQNYDD